MFVGYQKVFNRVKLNKLMEVLEKAGIPDLERRLIGNLYWKRNAQLRVNKTDPVNISRGVRQCCNFSPILFDLYSEKLMQEAEIGV